MSSIDRRVLAQEYVTIACAGVGELWREQFTCCIDAGVWPSIPAAAERHGWLPNFAHVRPGDLGLAVHAFRWDDPGNPPRNPRGAAYGPRAPIATFRQRAVFTEFVLFRATGAPHYSPAELPGVDPRFELHLPLTAVVRRSGVELRVADLNTVVADALHASVVNSCFPVTMPPATLGEVKLARASGSGAASERPLFTVLAEGDILSAPTARLAGSMSSG